MLPSGHYSEARERQEDDEPEYKVDKLGWGRVACVSSMVK